MTPAADLLDLLLDPSLGKHGVDALDVALTLDDESLLRALDARVAKPCDNAALGRVKHVIERLGEAGRWDAMAEVLRCVQQAPDPSWQSKEHFQALEDKVVRQVVDSAGWGITRDQLDALDVSPKRQRFSSDTVGQCDPVVLEWWMDLSPASFSCEKGSFPFEKNAARLLVSLARKEHRTLLQRFLNLAYQGEFDEQKKAALEQAVEVCLTTYQENFLAPACVLLEYLQSLPLRRLNAKALAWCMQHETIKTVLMGQLERMEGRTLGPSLETDLVTLETLHKAGIPLGKLVNRDGSTLAHKAAKALHREALVWFAVHDPKLLNQSNDHGKTAWDIMNTHANAEAEGTLVHLLEALCAQQAASVLNNETLVVARRLGGVRL